MLLANAEEAKCSSEQDEGDSMGDKEKLLHTEGLPALGAVPSTCPDEVQGFAKSHRTGARICPVQGSLWLRGSLGSSEHRPRSPTPTPTHELSQTYLTRRWSGGG